MPRPKKWDLMTPEEQEAWREKERAYNKARRQTPEGKAYQKAYRQTPEYKEHNKAYQKAYQQVITKQKAARNYMTALFAAQQFIQAIEQKP